MTPSSLHKEHPESAAAVETRECRLPAQSHDVMPPYHAENDASFHAQPLPARRFLKRGFDMAFAVVMLLLLSPLFLLLAFIVRLDGGPAFFRQKRLGLNGTVFECFKFRSMHAGAEESLSAYLARNPEAKAEWGRYQKLKRDKRITSFGQFMRRHSIDELPQLINVLKGDMSLVGPRPILPEQAELYGKDFIFYASMRPGLTGLWQISGRSQLAFSERVALECHYVRNWGLGMDVLILMKTIPALLKGGQAF